MNITCLKCHQVFSITAEQLGKRGKCPHCRATIVLPRSTNQTRYQAEQLEPPSRLPENLLCGFITLLVHLLVLFLCALVPWGDFAEGHAGRGEEILIGNLSIDPLLEISADELSPLQADSMADSPLDPRQEESLWQPDAAPSVTDPRLDVTLPAQSGGGEPNPQPASRLESTLLAGGEEDFGELITRLQQDGLDVVIVFDSTKSMKGEIEQVKNRIERIGSALFELIPKTRLSICTYRDYEDAYVAQGLPLTDNLTEVILYLEPIDAAGGGNIPEAVHAGLEWAIGENDFRPAARKVILLFGDAPPHPDKSVRCQKLASDFRKQGGVLSTVTCRQRSPLEDFDAIARIGGGESFLTRNEREIMSQLVVLVFGSRHRSKVLEAFQLLER